MALLALFAAAFWIDYLANEAGFLPAGSALVVEALIALLVARALVERRGRGINRLGIEFPLVLLASAGMLSALLHGTESIRVVLGLRVLFRFILLAYAAVNLGFAPKTWRRTIQMFLLLMAVQIPVALYQWRVLGKTDDQVFGTVRSTGVLAILIVFVLCLILSRILRDRAGLGLIVTGLLLMALPVLGEAKAFYLFLPIGAAIVLRHELRARPRRVLLAGVLAGVPAIAGFIAFGMVSGNADLGSLLSGGGRLSALFEQPRVAGVWEHQPADVAVAASVEPRWRAIRESWLATTSSLSTALVGHGVGSRTMTDKDRLSVNEATIFIAPIATRLYELGFGGLLLYWGVFLALLNHLSLARETDSPYWQAVRHAFPAMTVVYLLSDFYTDSLYDPLACTYWTVAAMLVARAHAIRQDASAGSRSLYADRPRGMNAHVTT